MQMGRESGRKGGQKELVSPEDHPGQTIGPSRAASMHLDVPEADPPGNVFSEPWVHTWTLWGTFREGGLTAAMG